VTDILDAITERMRKAEAACVELEADKEHAIKVSGDFIRLLHADIAELKARAIRAEAALAVTADEWLETAERLHAVCEKRLIAMADDDLPEDEFMAAPDRYQEAKNALRAHLRSHPAEAQLEAARKDGERYLWLRKGIGFSVDVPNGVNDKGKPRNVHYRFAYKTEPEYGNALDAAIDAALEATTPENRK